MLMGIGLLLVLVAIVAGVLAFFGNAEQATITLGGLSLTTSVQGVFLLGAVTMVVLIVGLLLVRIAARRRRAQRGEIRQLRREQHPAPTRDSGGSPPQPPDFGAPGPH